MWYFFNVSLLFLIVSTTVAYSTNLEEDDSEEVGGRVFLIVPISSSSSSMQRFIDDDEIHPKNIFNVKRAIPFNGGMYGKRSAGGNAPFRRFSGGMYGKRSDDGFLSGSASSQPHYAQRRAAIPFNGGMYGR
ncbi:unnamed protein product [Caenorhabditis angaria]|uniref:Uncharacterized protein n=1 Tax=Caenorhabditis angaria TaxID=860376 RepID=A0A9P1II07_9PELO|nr:unnamed protein product [Caenorhabditis angaria]